MNNKLLSRISRFLLELGGKLQNLGGDIFSSIHFITSELCIIQY